MLGVVVMELLDELDVGKFFEIVEGVFVFVIW